MSFKKNLRGAVTYAVPSSPTYRDGYDRIFGAKEKPPIAADCCEICGKPLPKGEEMFKYHGASGPCPEGAP